MPFTWMAPSARSRRASADRRARAQTHRRRFSLEQFEDRTLLSTFTWAATSAANWNSAGSWLKDGNPTQSLPGAADDVVFNATSTENATVAAATAVKSITIGAGYTGTIAVNASLTANGYFTQAGGDLTGAGPLKVSRDFTNTGGTFNVGSVQFINGYGVTVKAPSIAFNNVSVGFTGQAALQTVGHMTVNGDLTLNSRVIANNGITVKGNVTSNVTYASTGTGGVITLAGGGNQTVTGSNGAMMPGLNFAKTGGSVTITGIVSLFDGWDVNQPSNIPITTTGSTVRFVGPAVRTIDTGYASLNNAVIAIHGQAGVTVAKLKVGGDLTLNSVLTLDAPSGAITVAGNLTSTSADVRGNADITMIGGDGKTITGGDFPNGGIIIAKGGNNVTANVTTPLDGPLVINSVGAFGGSFAVGKNVAINTGSITSWNGGKLVFAGGNNQAVTISNGGRLPGVEIDKTGGTLTIPTAIDVIGNWKYKQGNINTAGTSIRFIGGDKTVSTTGDSGDMAFNNVEIALGGNSLNNNGSNMIVGGKLTLTSVNNINGTITALGDVDTSATTNVGSYPSGKILFTGAGVQNLTATVPGGRVPGVEIDKTGGSLTLAPGYPISVTGSWKYVAGTVDTAGSTVNFIGGDKTVDPGVAPNNMAFDNLVIDSDSLNASNPLKTVVVNGALTLTRVGAMGGVIEARGDVNTGVTANLYSWNGGKILFTGAGVQNLTATADGGRVPGVEINKSGGSLTLHPTNTIGVAGNWKYVKGTVVTTGSTVNFIGGDKTVDTGSSPKMTFGNVEITVGDNSFNVPNARTLGVNGSLTINSVANINAPTGAITVAGNLTSNDASVGGNANITLNGYNSTTIKGGAFPNGGIIIAKNSSYVDVDADVTTPLKGPLALKTLQRLTGEFQVAGNVTTFDTGVGGNDDNSPVLIFKGQGDQTLKAEVANAQVPGVEIDKPSGKLTVDSSNPISVTGNWSHTSGNNIVTTNTTIRFGGVSQTVDPGPMVFNNLDLTTNSIYSKMVFVDDVIVNGELTLGRLERIIGTIQARGDVTTGDNGVGGPGVILFNGTGNQTLKATVDYGQLPGVEINKATGVLTIGDDDHHPIGVRGNWTYVGNDPNHVDAVSKRTTIKFMGDNNITIKPGLMVFYNVDFGVGQYNHVEIVDFNDAPAQLLFAGTASNTNKVTKGQAVQTP